MEKDKSDPERDTKNHLNEDKLGMQSNFCGKSAQVQPPPQQQ